MPIVCPSRIVEVTVHGRGALVTRRVSVPDDAPDGDLALVVEGITVLAEPGSLRAVAVGGSQDRAVVLVRSAVTVPTHDAPPGESTERVQALARRLARLSAERESLDALRTRALALRLQPRLRGTSVEARTVESVAAATVLSQRIARLDRRITDLDTAREDVGRAYEAAALADAQARTADRTGTSHPTRTVTVHVTGTGRLDAVDVTYAVPAARWWPVYTLRIARGAQGVRTARWWIEALVAQRTGEDWSGVRLALSTADLVYDARLPELPSLRLGKAQPVAGRGYRAPPPGLDSLFAGYDRAFAPAPAVLPPALQAMPTGMAMPKSVAARMEFLAETEGTDDGRLADEPPTEASAQMFRGPPSGMTAAAAPRSHGGSGAGFGGPSVGGGGHPVPQARSRRGSRPGTVVETDDGDLAGQAPPGDDALVEPGDGWLDFDALALGGPGAPRRGRLVRHEEPIGAGYREEAEAVIQRVTPPTAPRTR